MVILLRRPEGFSGLLGLAVLATGLSANPCVAQQVTAAQGSVTIDVGVLNQLGPPVTPGAYAYGQSPTYPAMIYGPPAYGQQVYGQTQYNPYSSAYGQTYGGLMFPPQRNPVSTLTVPAPAGSTPYAPPQTAASAPAPEPAAQPAASTTMSPPPPASTTLETAVPAATPTTTTASTEPTTTTEPTATTTTEPAATTTTEPTATATTEQAATTPAAPATPPPPAPEPTTAGTMTTQGSGATTTAASTDTTSAATTLTPAAPAATATTTTTGDTAAAPAGAAAATTGGQTQSAAIPPAAATEGQLRIVFPTDSAEIPDAVKAELDALAQKMAADDNMRLQLLAYASGTPETASRARRMSLSRALAVRSYLIKAGVRSTRMDVRALGNNVQGEPADRVDILPKAQ